MQASKLQEVFLDALQRCAPDRLIANRLEPRDGESGFAWLGADPSDRFNVKVTVPSRLWLFGAGKAAATMAMGVLDKLGSQIHGGALIVPSEILHASMFSASLRGGQLGPLRVLEGSHPFPDERSLEATRELVSAVETCGPNDHAIFVLSGGASALLVQPAPGVTLEQKTALLREMMERGAPIAEINAARQRLSLVKGGKLAARFPCPVTVLLLSDVAPDLPEPMAVVGSGPLWTGAKVSKNGRIRHVAVADGRTLAWAAAQSASDLGFGDIEVIEEPVVGEVSAVARQYAQQLSRHSRGARLRIRFGEPVVQGKQLGIGGRSQQLALELSRALAGKPGWAFLAAGSDGIDGPTDAAGAEVDGSLWERAIDEGLDPGKALERRDAYPLLRELKSLVFTGPTGNNLQDLHLLLSSRIGV